MINEKMLSKAMAPRRPPVMSQPIKSRQVYHTMFISHCHGASELILFSASSSTIRKQMNGVAAKSSHRLVWSWLARIRCHSARKGRLTKAPARARAVLHLVSIEKPHS